MPTLVIAEMAAITINPAMSAYSSTSPPPSSFKHLRISLLIRTFCAIGTVGWRIYGLFSPGAVN